MNLSKIDSKAVKPVETGKKGKTLSLEPIKKVMGGGAYSSHSCVPKLY